MFQKAIKVLENEVHINSDLVNNIYDINNDYVIKLTDDSLVLKVYINKKLKQLFNVDKIKEDELFQGKYFHFRIIIRRNHAIMIDGLLTEHKELIKNSKDNLGIRFQPIFLSNDYFDSNQLKGKGLFSRGLHFNGAITSSVNRLVCICDECNKSFTIQSFHSGFSDVNYFYSDDGLTTLTISTWEFQGLPGINTKEIDYDRIKEIESMLPKLPDGQSFKYYNSFSCPHCLSPYIDFNRNPQDRQYEYYFNIHSGKKSISFSLK